MLSNLSQTGAKIADAVVRRTILRLASISLPPGVRSEASPDGVILSGRHLKSRVITDPSLRNFGR
jgi:hypothetical protein